MVPNIVLLYEDLMDAYWLVLCKLLQVGTLPLKLDVLKSLAKIISSAGCYKKMVSNKTVFLNLPNASITYENYFTLPFLDRH